MAVCFELENIQVSLCSMTQFLVKSPYHTLIFDDKIWRLCFEAGMWGLLLYGASDEETPCVDELMDGLTHVYGWVNNYGLD